MAGKPIIMSQIKQLLRLHKLGRSKRQIARNVGMSKNTVKQYLYRVQSTGMDIASLLELDDPVLEAKLLAGTPSYKKDDRYDTLKDQLAYYACELSRTGVTRLLLWEEYKSGKSQWYSYTQFCFHLNQYLSASKPAMVLHHLPGEKLYIDFAGKKLSYIDKATGEIIECQVFVACLPYSDYCFAMAVHSQTIADFIYALICCLKAIGGVTQTLVPDNLKSAVIKANNYEPNINRVFEDFANHYDTTVTPARAEKPKDKALVENQVQLIYSRVYARIRNLQFFDILSLNQAIADRVLEHNQTRMQQKPYCRQERFLADEKHTLKPLPEQDFEIKYYKTLKVAKNNHIYLSMDKHYYSVPYRFIGQQANVIFTQKLVQIYIKGEKVAAHLRSAKYGYTTQKEHLCSQHQHYMDRSPDYYCMRAKNHSQEFYMLISQIFKQEKYPEQLYRTCDGLFSLQRKTQASDFNAACQIALKYQNYSYRFIVNILTNGMTQIPEILEDTPLPEHENTRGAGYYK